MKSVILGLLLTTVSLVAALSRECDGSPFATHALCEPTASAGAVFEAITEFSSQSRQRASGAGLAPQSDMDAIYKAIDPEGKMSESERTMAGLAHVWEWNLKQNRPQEAEKAAASMVQYGRVLSSRYQAIASAAAEKGDVDGFLKAILKVYSAIPDGKDMKLIKRPDGSVVYRFTDVRSGKVSDQGIATPDQILAYASRGRLTSFDSLIASASGQHAGAKLLAAEPMPSLKDRVAAMDRINEITSDQKIYKEPPGEEFKYLASQILRLNDMSAMDALIAVETFTVVSTKPTFKIERSGDRGAVATMADGRKIRLSKVAFGNLVALLGKAKRAYDARQEADAKIASEVAKRKTD